MPKNPPQVAIDIHETITRWKRAVDTVQEQLDTWRSQGRDGWDANVTALVMLRGLVADLMDLGDKYPIPEVVPGVWRVYAVGVPPTDTLLQAAIQADGLVKDGRGIDSWQNAFRRLESGEVSKLPLVNCRTEAEAANFGKLCTHMQTEIEYERKPDEQEQQEQD